jgi:hypothetical protein
MKKKIVKNSINYSNITNFTPHIRIMKIFGFFREPNIEKYSNNFLPDIRIFEETNIRSASLHCRCLQIPDFASKPKRNHSWMTAN